MADTKNSGMSNGQPKKSPAQQATVRLPTGDTVSVSTASPGMATDAHGAQFRIPPQLTKSAFASAAKSAQADQKNLAALAASETKSTT